jgi:GT2 family glycosyltransferase
MSEQPSVSVVTVGWNHSRLTQAFLESLERALPPGRAAQVEAIVVDNGSQDDTPELLERWRAAATGPRFKQVLRSDDNRGFAAGGNRGLCAARGVYVLLANNDVVFEADPFEACLSAVRAQPRALFGPRLVRRAGTWNRLHGRGVRYLEGHCLFASASVWRELGLWVDGHYRGSFDEAFHPAFYEDVDLGLRARLQGVALRELKLPLRHLGSRTTRGTPGFDYLDVIRANQVRFEAKWAHLDPERLGRPSTSERLAAAASAVVASLLPRRSEG